MSNSNPDTSPEFFDRLYAAKTDPWNFLVSDYEQSRYHEITRMAGDEHLGSVFEPGCSIGGLSRILAKKSDRLLAMDCSSNAIRQARENCIEASNIRFQVGVLPEDMPAEQFDTIVFSEIGYYFEVDELERIARELWNHLSAAGSFTACHWLGHSDDHRLSGQTVIETLKRCLPAEHSRDVFKTDQFVIQHWSLAQ